MFIDSTEYLFSCKFYIENRENRGVILAHHFWLDGYIYAFNQLLIEKGTLKMDNNTVLGNKSIDDVVAMIDRQCSKKIDDTFPNVTVDVINSLLANIEE